MRRPASGADALRPLPRPRAHGEDGDHRDRNNEHHKYECFDFHRDVRWPGGSSTRQLGRRTISLSAMSLVYTTKCRVVRNAHSSCECNLHQSREGLCDTGKTNTADRRRLLRRLRVLASPARVQPLSGMRPAVRPLRPGDDEHRPAAARLATPAAVADELGGCRHGGLGCGSAILHQPLAWNMAGTSVDPPRRISMAGAYPRTRDFLDYRILFSRWLLRVIPLVLDVQAPVAADDSTGGSPPKQAGRRSPAAQRCHSHRHGGQCNLHFLRLARTPRKGVDCLSPGAGPIQYSRFRPGGVGYTRSASSPDGGAMQRCALPVAGQLADS